jgi:hypothetical protein
MQQPINPPITRETEIAAFEIESQTDSPIAKTVTARVSVENVGPVSFVLWSGAAYDSIGNWTQEQADARVLELIESTYGE